MSTIDPDLAKQLEAFLSKGMSVEQTTAALEDGGYTKEEISQALPQAITATGPADNLDPDQQAAVALSNAAAESQYEQLRQQTIADGLAGGFGADANIRAVYEANFYDDIGVGWWSTHLLDLLGAAVAYKLKLPWVSYIISTAIAVHVGLSAYRTIMWRRYRKKLNR